MKELFFFTNTYPYGFGETWKQNELAYLSRSFDSIIVIPFSNGEGEVRKDVPANVTVCKPLLPGSISIKKNVFKLVFSKYFFLYLSEFFRKKVFLKKIWFFSWLSASIKAELLRRNKLISLLINDGEYGKGGILYFFWAKENAYIIPLIRKNKFRKIVVRFHGYDLYEDRNVNKGYIPYRKQMFRKMTDAVFVSHNGFDYLAKKYSKETFAKHVFRLGVIEQGVAVAGDDTVMHIYTCSMMIPLKRLVLLAKALQLSNLAIEWHHIGSGPERDNILAIVKQFPDTIRFIEHGFVAPEKVVLQYVNAVADLFINISDSEGLPVSIMEAISAGIPVLATNVGGTAEIVNNEVGILVDKNISPEQLRDEINKFYFLTAEEKSKMRVAARKYFFQLWDAGKNAELMSNFLSGN